MSIRGFLVFCGAANLAGALVRLPHLPWGHPYMATMALMVLLALAALLASRRSEMAALNLFCWGALPVTMLAAASEKALHPELTWTMQAIVPVIGLLVVGILGKDKHSTLAYSLGAAGATAWMVWALYGRQGAAGAACVVVPVVGGLLKKWAGSTPVQLARKVDEQEGLVRRMRQEAQHDRRAIQRAIEATGFTGDTPETD